MANAFTNFYNSPKPFGLNVVSSSRLASAEERNLLKQQTQMNPLKPLFNFLKDNENVFNGDIIMEQNKLRAETFNTGARLREAEEKVSGKKPASFDIKF